MLTRASMSARWVRAALPWRRKTWTDPYQIAIDAQILLSHANDQVRLFGGGASGRLPLDGIG